MRQSEELLAAAKNGDLAGVQAALARGASVNCKDGVSTCLRGGGLRTPPTFTVTSLALDGGSRKVN